MGRNRYGGAAAIFVVAPGGPGASYKRPDDALEYEFWSGDPEDLSRVQYTDLRAVGDPTTVVSSVPSLSNGSLAPFDGPSNGAVTLWASADGGVTGEWILCDRLHKVAASGSYLDLGDKPTIPTTPGAVGADPAGAAAAVQTAAATDATTKVNAERDRALAVEANKADLVAGKIPQSQIPDIAIEHGVITVANAAARYALVLGTTVQLGQPVVQASTGQTFLLIAGATDPSQSGQWTEIPAIGKVQTVNGRQGAVVVDKTDVGLDHVSNLSPAELAADPSHTAAFVGGRACTVTGVAGLPAPTGVGMEFVISAAGLDDIRFNGTSL